MLDPGPPLVTFVLPVAASAATDLAEALARNGTPFHKAHQLVGRLVLESVRAGRKPSDWTAEQLSTFAPEFTSEVARLLMLRAAWLKDEGRPAMHAAAMAKVFASEVAMKAATKAVQIHGGAGYITEFPVERIFRDAKLTEIGEGTSEVQRMVIAREILKVS